MPTLVIGNKLHSSWSLRPWLLLRQFGIPFEEVLIPFGQTFDDPDWKRAIAYEFLAPGGALLLTFALQIPKDKKKADNNAKIVHVSGDVHTSKNRPLGIEQYNRLMD